MVSVPSAITVTYQILAQILFSLLPCGYALPSLRCHILLIPLPTQSKISPLFLPLTSHSSLYFKPKERYYILLSNLSIHDLLSIILESQPTTHLTFLSKPSWSHSSILAIYYYYYYFIFYTHTRIPSWKYTPYNHLFSKSESISKFPPPSQLSDMLWKQKQMNTQTLKKWK